MREEEEQPRGTVVELMLREPEIVAWLEDYRPAPDEAPDDDTPPRVTTFDVVRLSTYRAEPCCSRT
jgi:hypothetical protein